VLAKDTARGKERRRKDGTSQRSVVKVLLKSVVLKSVVLKSVGKAYCVNECGV
jgi:hypothetical protein